MRVCYCKQICCNGNWWVIIEFVDATWYKVKGSCQCFVGNKIGEFYCIYSKFVILAKYSKGWLNIKIFILKRNKKIPLTK